ncbi:hypothetical protein FRC19_011186 [Serendipita sp. 401]|nr:hypothetical protein FRC19_011186 [Serendipita sp. 401]KAG9052228.1 hypothetical protein FS842_010292 [Serendipita sp. 407]
MRLLWVLFVFQAPILPLVFGFNKPQVRVTTTFKDFDARIMDYWGGGGGKWAEVSGGHPFAGRTFGGAKREEVRGTRAFGSGYPYGADNQSTLAGRPFPFGVWPLYWDQNFMDADEYGPQYDAVRPGGFIAYVPLRTTKEYFNVTEDEVYYAIGDRESLLPLMISYVTWCHVNPAWPSKLDPSSPNATIKLENVIQYFRGSSLALASPTYNNTFARTPNSEMQESTPPPEFVEYSTFRKCVDSVTEKALAIVNKVPTEKAVDTFVSTLPGIGWILGCVAILLLAWTYHFLQSMREVFHVWLYGDAIVLERVGRQRQGELQYERYP